MFHTGAGADPTRIRNTPAFPAAFARCSLASSSFRSPARASITGIPFVFAHPRNRRAKLPAMRFIPSVRQSVVTPLQFPPPVTHPAACLPHGKIGVDRNPIQAFVNTFHMLIVVSLKSSVAFILASYSDTPSPVHAPSSLPRNGHFSDEDSQSSGVFIIEKPRVFLVEWRQRVA